MPKPSILVISFSHLASDPRVNRQLRLLAPEFTLTAAGFGDPGLPGVEFVSLPSQPKTRGGRALAGLRLLAGRDSDYYWAIDSVQAALAILGSRAFDLIIANDSNTWALAVALRGKSRLLFDAHEYAPREFEDIWWWRLLHGPYKTRLCHQYLPQADGSLTVCPGIAAEYFRVFGVLPRVVMNVPPRQNLHPSPTNPNHFRMVHHGGATASRKIENMIQMMDHLDERFSLDLILVASDPRYLERLKSLAQRQSRIRFLPPIPMQDIPSFINNYDLGLYILEPNSFNNRHALPNKFFEFIQARLGVAIGPSPEMSRFVRQYDCGVVSPDFSPAALAAALRPVTAAQIDAWKQGAHAAADILNWERESEILSAEVRRLTTLPPCVA